MDSDAAYELAIRVYKAGERGEPMPEVPKEYRPVCEALWHQARRSAGLE